MDLSQNRLANIRKGIMQGKSSSQVKNQMVIAKNGVSTPNAKNIATNFPVQKSKSLDLSITVFNSSVSARILLMTESID